MKSIIEHKISKIKDKNKKELADFCFNRMNGAKDLAANAKSKGGLAILTAYHFEAKLPVYKKIIDLISSGDDIGQKIKTMYTEKLSSLSQGLSHNQRKMQELTGELEVLGEVYVKSRELKVK